MKAKTISKILRKRVDAWLESIEDIGVRDLAAKGTIVTGGCIASMLLGEQVNDFDVYLRDLEATRRLAEYYVARFRPRLRNDVACSIAVSTDDGRVRVIITSAGIASENGASKSYQYFEARPEDEAGEYVGEIMQDVGDIQEVYESTEDKALATEDNGKPKYRPVFLSTNAITLSGRVQIVLRFYGKPDSIHENYDYVHCTNYWTSWEGKLVLRQPALESLLAKELIYVGSKYPVCSVVRLRKFIRRGWTINAGQILKILMQVSALDLTDIAVLEDQLTGVDCAYFREVLEQLRAKDPEKVNVAYLIEIIDRMF